MFYIDFTAPDGKTYRIDVSKNPVIYKCPVCGETSIYNLIKPVKIVAFPAQNKGNERKRNGKMNLWKIGFMLRSQNVSVWRKIALFPRMRLNVWSSLKTKNKDMELKRCRTQSGTAALLFYTFFSDSCSSTYHHP